MGQHYSTLFKMICRFVLISFYFQSVNPASYGYGLHDFHWPIGFSEAAAETQMPDVSPPRQKAVRKNPVIAPTLQPDDYLGSTPEANTSDPYIIEKAQALKHDPVKIFQFVRDQIGNEVYKGSLRGARGTLWSKAGNALDKASLLIALLRVSDIKARYAQGTLAETQAKEIINSMFKMPLNVVGCPDEDAPRSEPDKNADLLAEARQHYWVEYNDGAGFRSVDPSFAAATLGETYTAPQDTFNEVPDNLRHKVTVRLKRELYGQFAGILGNANALDMQTALEHTFITAELVGKPLSVGHFVNSESLGGFGLTTTTNTYSPYFLLGQGDSDISDDTLIRGKDYQESLTNFPLGSSYLTGVFLEFDVIDANGKSQLYERTIADRMGYAARQNGGTSTPTTITADTTLITEMDIVTANILPGLQDPLALKPQQKRLQRLQDQYNAIKPILDGIPGTGVETDLQIQAQNKATTISRNMIAVSGENIGMTFSLASDESLRQLEKGYMTKAYSVSPRITLAQSTLEGDKFTFSIDLRKNDIRTKAFPQQVNNVEYPFEIMRGMIESSLEGKVLAANVGQSIISISDVFSNIKEGNQIILLTPNNKEKIELLKLSSQAKARISQAINSGKIVVTPLSDVTINGQDTVKWFETDTVSGQTISVSEDGGHSDVLEYLILLENKQLKAEFAVIGTVQGFATAQLTFVGELLKAINENPGQEIPIKEILKKAKEETKSEIVNILSELGIKEAFGAELGEVLICLGNSKSFGEFVKCIIKLNLKKLFNKRLLDLKSAFDHGFAVGIYAGYLWLARNEPNDPFVFPYLSSDLAPVPASVTPNSKPGILLNVATDSLFTFPVNGAELPSVFKAQIQNTGPSEDTFNLTFTNVPDGFKAQSSIPTVTVPAGATAEVGVCLSPTNNTIPAKGTSIPFTLDVSSTTQPTVTTSNNQNFVVSGVHAVNLSLTPAFDSTTPGGTINTTLTIASTGNVSEQITLKANAPDSLQLTGLPSTINLKAGETQKIPLTVIVGTGTAIGKSLEISITGDLSGKPASGPVTANIQVDVLSANVLPIAQYAGSASETGNDQLAQVLFKISDLTAQVPTNSCDSTLMSSLALAYDQLLQLADAYPWLAGYKLQIQQLRDLAVACDGQQLLKEAKTFFKSLPQPLAGGLPQLSLTPATLELEPDGAGAFALRLENPSVKAIELNLQLTSKLPKGVTAQLSQTQVSLAAGEVLDKSSAKPVTLNVDVPAGMPLSEFSVSVQASGFAQGSHLNATGLVSVREALADVLNVAPKPNVVDSGAGVINADVNINNTANTTRQVLALPEIVDVGGTVLTTLPTVSVLLSPGNTAQVLNLISIPVEGLADGVYRLRVSLQNSSGVQLPGRSAEGTFFVGSPIVAELQSNPIVVPPGDSRVTAKLSVTNRLGITNTGSQDVIVPLNSGFPIAVPDTEGYKVIVMSTDAVIATYQGNSAAYSNDLYLMLDATGKPGDDGDLTNDLFIFNNHSSEIGSTANLGAFPVGTELIFRLRVNNTGHDFFTGPAERNPDSHEHARVQENWTPQETLVSFEDLYGGAYVYNDLSFSFTNVGTFADGVTLEIHHGLPNNGYQVNQESISPTPEAVTATEIDWAKTFVIDEPNTAEFSVQGTVSGLLPGETRAISTNTDIVARYLDSTGNFIEVPLHLPPLSVAAAHIIDLQPADKTSTAGEAAEFSVRLDNPSASERTYTLNVSGAGDLSPQLSEAVTVPPGQSVSESLTLTTPLTASGDRAFSVNATIDGVTDTVSGVLHISAVDTSDPSGPIALDALAVDVALLPSSVSGGQGANAYYQVQVSNTGDETTTFNLSGAFPAGISAAFGSTRVEVLPGAAKLVPLTLKPKPGKAIGAYPFSVKAVAVGDSGISDAAQGVLNVSGYGVAVSLNPPTGKPGSTFQLSVTNIGNQTDSFDLALAGPVAVFATLPVNSVSLKAGATQIIPINVGKLDSALPGKLTLVAAATSKADTNASSFASANLTIANRHGVSAAFKPESVTLNEPGATALLMQVENLGNVEDAYSAEIIQVDGPLTVSLTGLDGKPTQSIPLFRLPGLATGLLNLSAHLNQTGTGIVKVRIRSTTDTSVYQEVTARVSSSSTNKRPDADAGQDKNVIVAANVTLDGSASSDPDGDLISYLWHFVSVPKDSAVNDASLDDKTTAKPKFKPDLVGVYKLKLLISDGQLVSKPAFVSITAAKPNIPPNANAGNDKTVALGKSAVLNGKASNDPDNGPEALKYFWSLTNQPDSGNGLLNNADQSIAHFSADFPGVYAFDLKVFDGEDYDNDTMNVTVTYENQPPVADAGADLSIHLNEKVSLNAGASEDPDNKPQPLTYSWRFVSMSDGSQLGNAVIVTDSQTPAKASFTPDVKGNYVLQVKVSDGLDEATDNILVKVLPALSAGKPNFIVNTVSQELVSKDVYKIGVKFTNTGPGTAKNFQITDLVFKVLNGKGSVSYNPALASPLPLIMPHVDVDTSFTVDLVVNVGAEVQRFTVTETGSVFDIDGGSYLFSEVQSVIPQN